MRSGILTSSRFGKFYSRCQQNVRTVQLTTASPIQKAQFTITADRLYLLDGTGNLTCLSLVDNSISTFGSLKLQHFEIESNNSYSVYAVSKQSQLWHISFQNKNKSKILNLNLGKVINFQKNNFTNLLLIVSFQIVMLIDVSSQGNKIRSIKAMNGETFSGGRFLNQNRFLVLAVKSNELRVVQILGMKTIQKVTLPFQIKGIKLQATLDGSAIAVFGDSNIMLIGNVSLKGKLSYQITELPIKYIIQLRFTYQNDIVFLANNRILYGITPKKQNKLIEIFNQQQKIGYSSFEVALNACRIALTAGKTVHIITLSQGVRKLLEETQGITIQFTQRRGEYDHKVDSQFEYDEEDLEEDGHNASSISHELIYPPGLPDFNSNSDIQAQLLAEVRDLKAPRSQQLVINAIYLYLHQFESSRKLVHLHKLQKILSYIKDSKQSAAAVYHILTLLGTSISDQSLQKFALILAPRVFQRVQKVDGGFGQFVTRNMLNLFGDYIDEKIQRDLVRVILKNSHREWFISIFIISLLLQMRANSQSWPLPHLQQIRLSDVVAETQNLMSNPRHAYIFAKELPEQKEEVFGQDLQALLTKREVIKSTLTNIRKNYA